MRGKDRATGAPPPEATALARLTTDAAVAQEIDAAVTEAFDSEELATAAFEEADGRWSLTIHFRHRPDEAAVRALIASAAGSAVADALAFETLAPTDWVRKSLDGLKPVEAGRFVVHGAHARARVAVNRIGAQIEAALAFGTGHHGSTRGCLLALDLIAKAHSRKHRASRAASRSTGKRRRQALVLDVGTGTGVLAIAAAKALRRPVLASDIDARAVGIARDNARINGAAAYVETIRAAGLGAHRFRERAPFQLIFANILLEPLKELATPMARLVAPGGQVVLSGLLAAQAGAALACYRARGLVLARRVRLEGWMTLVLVRRVRRSDWRGCGTPPCHAGESIAGLPAAP
ncbi:MAG TPA: 50S ribosomal protein L11 methyltransferase [Xanthobacteraceae bacterium]